jgi:repressor LexA
MNDLTPKQGKVLDFVASQRKLGNSVSQRDIARHFGLSQNAIFQLIRYLRAKGYIDGASQHRGVRPSSSYADSITGKAGIPLVGRIAAGEPILAQESIEDHIDLNRIVSANGGKFFLKVAGDSMVDVGIMDGDYVAISPEATVQSGDIAAVLLGDEATVKRIYFEKDRIVLKAENRDGSFKNRYIRKSDPQVRIIGKVAGCFRDKCG